MTTTDEDGDFRVVDSDYNDSKKTALLGRTLIDLVAPGDEIRTTQLKRAMGPTFRYLRRQDFDELFFSSLARTSRTAHPVLGQQSNQVLQV